MVSLQFRPDISPDKTIENLGRLIIRGQLRDGDMESRIARLGERFRLYASTCPQGLWAPGLALTNEYRAQIELYLPMAVLKNAFRRFLFISLQYSAKVTETAIHSAITWPDALHRLQPHVTCCNPAALLRRLTSDENFRISFLLALFLQKQHGAGFNRYSGQPDFLQQWLKKTKSVRKDVLRCLDAACSTGESTYELAMLLMENWMEPGSFLVHGSTIDPLELFAAAHIFFPHEPARQEAFRKKTEPVFTSGADKHIMFFTEDISRPSDKEKNRYDIILCNGLLGGPKYHTAADLERVVSALASRLREGGIILAADRFHGGWKKVAPAPLIQGAFRQAGLRVHRVTDSLFAEKT